MFVFSLKQKDVFGKKKSSLSGPKPNPDVVQRVVADVGHASDLLAITVATSTVHTAVVSQKRENISVSDELSPTTRETLCRNGFLIQRTNVKREKIQRKNGIFSSDSRTTHVRRAKPQYFTGRGVLTL